MLNDEDKEKVRAEEIFRYEIRREIESKATNKWIAFFNTAFGIWLLSTVVVGLVSVSYKTWQENLQSQKANQRNITMVSDEGDFPALLTRTFAGSVPPLPLGHLGRQISPGKNMIFPCTTTTFTLPQ